MGKGNGGSSVNSTDTLLAVLLLCLVFTSVRAQQIVDKIVATVNDGVKTELITYSDLRWQLALQPGPPLAPPRPKTLTARCKPL